MLRVFLTCVSFMTLLPNLVDVTSPPKKCISGPFHKPSPGPEGNDYVECHSWKTLTCCRANFTEELSKHRVKNLYDYHWDRCGPISQTCEQYIKDEECFYQCEPYTVRFQGPTPDTFTRVPICKAYCDAWFNACQDDKTCVVDWLNGFDYSNDTNNCPKGSKCRTFKEVYQNGKNLCDKMWAHAFRYEETKNCMVMSFDPSQPNPNALVFPTTSDSRRTEQSFVTILNVAILFLARV